LLYHDLNYAIVIGPTRVTWCAKIYNVARLHHVARETWYTVARATWYTVARLHHVAWATWYDVSYVSQCICVDFLVRPLYYVDQ